jgi:hypothetical protein
MAGDEEQRAEHQREDRPREADEHQPRVRRDALVEHVAPRGEHRRQRVQLEPVPVALRHLLPGVEHRRDVHPDPQEIREEAREVAEVDLGGGAEHRHPGGEDGDHRHDRERPQHLEREPLAGSEVDDEVDRHRGDEALEGGGDRGERQQAARERRVENETSTADNGVGALVGRRLDDLVEEQAAEQVGEEADRPRVVADQVDEQEVDGAEQQRIEQQPELAEGGVEVLRAHRGARQLEGERPPLPDELQVVAERRQPHLVGHVDVALGVLVVAIDGVLVLVPGALGLGDDRPARTLLLFSRGRAHSCVVWRSGLVNVDGRTRESPRGGR